MMPTKPGKDFEQNSEPPRLDKGTQADIAAIKAGKTKCEYKDIDALFNWCRSKGINTGTQSARDWFFHLHDVADKTDLRFLCSDVLPGRASLPNLSHIIATLYQRRAQPVQKQNREASDE